MATAGGTCAIAAAIAAPAIAFVSAPLGDASGGGQWVRVGKLSDFKDGEARRVSIVADKRDAWTVEKSVELGSVWIVKQGEGVIAFSAVCPHLGCSVNAVGAQEGGGFSCPCHTSSFDAAGTKKSGPSPRDLDRLDTRIEEGFVAVDYRRFRIGIAQKVQT